MSKSLRALAGAPLPLLALLAPVAQAQIEPDRATVVVTGRRSVKDVEAEIRKTPGGVDVEAADEFEDRLAVSLRDTLAWSPGVYAQPRYGQEVRISIRGSGISRGAHLRGLLLFQDGVPLNLADNNGDFQEFDPQVLERIEVYRGGNALRFGGSALGGAINAVTPTGRTAPSVQARIDGGSYGTLRTLGAVGVAAARGDAYLALTTDRSDGDRRHARRDAIRFNGNVGLMLTDRIENRFYATVNRIDQDIPGFLTRAQALTTPKLALPDRIALDQERNMDSLRLQNRTNVEFAGGSLQFGLFLNGKDLDHPVFQVLDQKSLDYGGYARAELAGDLGGVPLEATLGATARFGHVRARQFTNVSGRRGVLTADARQEARTIDAYAELRAQPLAGLWLVAGGVHSRGRRTVANRLQPQRSGDAAFDAFSPKLGLLYEPAADVQLYANYSRSVELPGYAELNQIPFAVNGASTPGFVPLDPQRAWTVEIGTRGTRGIARWDLTVYRADLRGELLGFNQSPDVPAATFNAGRTRHQGVEAGLDLTPLPWLGLRQTYQLNDFRFRGDVAYGGNRLPVVPRHLLRAELRLGTERLSVSPAVEWVPRGAWADYANTTRAPGYALLGVGARAEVRDGINLFVDARNLTGEKAIGDVSAAVRATPASAIYYPVERRAVYGGVQAAF